MSAQTNELALCTFYRLQYDPNFLQRFLRAEVCQRVAANSKMFDDIAYSIAIDKPDSALGFRSCH